MGMIEWLVPSAAFKAVDCSIPAVLCSIRRHSRYKYLLITINKFS